MPQPIADLHCDLLSFLVDHPSKTVEDPSSKASFSQMKQGGIVFQALTIFTPTTPSAHLYGKKQLDAFSHLLQQRPHQYQLFDPSTSLPLDLQGPIQVSLVFENAQSICREGHSLEEGLHFLEEVQSRFKHILYISLTWDLENRFGGGCGSSIGLKEEGKILLEWMDRKKIAVDFSHASDPLAEAILNFIEKKSLQIPVLASHSNLRAISPRERNLPLHIAQEIIHRKGLIGLNFFAPFIGKAPHDLLDHLERLMALGGKESISFGGDFFFLDDYPYLQKKYETTTAFFPEFSDASCYPFVLSLFQERLNLSPQEIQKIASSNVQNYLKRLFS